MRTIHKYHMLLQVTNYAVWMPEGAQVVSVQMQNGMPCIWAMVDTQDKLVNREFKWIATGDQIPEDGGLYLATLQFPGGYVFHLFETN